MLLQNNNKLLYHHRLPTNQIGVLGAIASNLFANSPDAMVGGYHPPSNNTLKSKSETIPNGSFNNDHKSALTLQQQSTISLNLPTNQIGS